MRLRPVRHPGAPVVAALLVASLAGGRAAADPAKLAGEPPTPGVHNPSLGVAGDVDAGDIEKNPAGLGLLKSWSVSLLDTETTSSTSFAGRGTALFVATPLPYFSSIIVGAGLQIMRPPRDFPFGDTQKLSLSLAWRPFQFAAIGLTYSHVFSQKAPLMDGLDTLDLAIALRVGSLVAVGFVVRDLNSPPVAGLPLQRVYEPEVAIRPFGTSRVEIAAGARFGERRADVVPRFRLWVEPLRGLFVKAEAEWRPDVDGDGVAENDVRVSLGVEVNFSRFGIGAWGLFGREAGGVVGQGGTVSLRISGERYPTVWAGPSRLEKLDLGPGASSGRGLLATLLRMHRLERDPSLAGVVVVLGDLDGGWATAEELRAGLVRLRRAGKHVYVYLSDCSTRGYFVATAGERLFADPAGTLRLTGLTSTSLYYRGTADLLGVRADFVKIDEYKSAPEQYMRTGPTEPAREQRDALVGDTWRTLTEGIAQARGVDVARVVRWIDGGPYAARDAKAAGLVDEIKPGDEIEDAIEKLLGRRLSLHEGSSAPERFPRWSRPKIAVITVDGDITDGQSAYIPILDMKMAGLKTLLPAIAAARRDPAVRAIVVRVNSPGGSAFASDLLARELDRARDEKPVICSFGDTAASGGYFLAAPCHQIFAASATLTGSIGIFTGKFDVSGLGAKLGVSTQTYERGRHASIESLWRPYTDEERVVIRKELQAGYDRFLEAVAHGRKLTVGQVDALGRGHVWSGRAAQSRGLVDHLGGFVEAIEEAKRRANLSATAPVELDLVPEEPTLLGQLARLLGINLQAAAPTDSLTSLLAPSLRAVLQQLPATLLTAPSSAQALMDPVVLVR